MTIRVQPNDLTQNVQLLLPASFSAEQPDVITITVGAAPLPADTVTLTETGNATHVFAGAFGPGTVTLTFATVPSLSTAADTINATLAKALAGQTVSSVALSFIETGEATNVFTVAPPSATSYQVQTSPGGPAHPGTFLPTIVRFPASAGQCLIAVGYKINIMDRDWSLKLKTYQGEEYAYVVDDNDKPVVFNPSLYAQTDIQTQKVDPAKGFQLEIKAANGTKIWSSPKPLGVAHGLVIYGAEGAWAEDFPATGRTEFRAMSVSRGSGQRGCAS